MSVDVQTTEWNYVGNGVSTTFGFDNLVLASGDLVVSGWDADGDPVALGGYSVTGVGVKTGGTVVFETPPPATVTLLKIRRATTALQQTQLSDYTRRPAATEEADLDRAIMLAQEARTAIGRALRAPDRETSIDTIPFDRAGRVLGFDGSGQPIVSTLTLAQLEEPQTGAAASAAAAAASALLAAEAAVAAGGSEVDAEAAEVAAVAAAGAAGAARVAAEQAQAAAEAAMDGKADINSPTFTGDPKAPTPSKTDADTSLATTGFVKVRETWVNAYDYVTDPLQADWTSFINAAIAALPSGGGCVRMPVGNVPLAAGLAAIQNKHVRLEGFGTEITTILFSHATQEPITFNHTTGGWASEVHNLAIVAQGVDNPNAAIRMTYPAFVPGNHEDQPGPRVKNVSIRGATWASDQFRAGIALTHGFRALVDNCVLLGEALTTDAALVILAGDGCKEVTIRRCRQIYGSALVATVPGAVIEGLLVDDADVVATNLLASLDVANGPDFKFINCHAQCFIGGIWAEGVSQLFARGNTFYKRDDAPGEPSPGQYKCFQLLSCGDFDVCNNFAYVIDPTDHGSDVFMDANNSTGHASRNRFTGFDFGFNLVNNSAVVIEGNRYSGVGTFAVNVPATATVRGNFNGARDAVAAFGANDATPSVGGSYAKYFRTANTGATTITAFDDAFEGQEFTLLVNDANTTIQHNAGLIMKGGTNATPGNGAMFRFLRDSTAWREVSRNY